MCAKCPADNEDMETVYGMGVQKIQSYGEHFTKIIIDFLEEQSAAGGADAETLQLTTELTPEQIEETTFNHSAVEKLLTEIRDLLKEEKIDNKAQNEKETKVE